MRTRSAAVPASAYEPDDLARALLRGAGARADDLRAAGGTYGLDDVVQLLQVSRQSVANKVRKDELLAVPGPHNERRYPARQFTSTGIVPGLGDVLRALPSENPWFRLHWLVSDDAALGNTRPIDRLLAGDVDLVVAAARSYGEMGG